MMSENNNILSQILNTRKEEGTYRNLTSIHGQIDFCSNDYLGLAQDLQVAASIEKSIKEFKETHTRATGLGATGSRLISGNHALIEQFESDCAKFHQSESALLFGSGFEANTGLISAIGQEGQVFFCDKLIHASLIDGLKLSKAEKRIFKHNDLNDLRKLLNQYPKETVKWIVVESVYSMDGDIAPLQALVELKEEFHAELIVDEAHAGGIYGTHGQGLCHELNLSHEIFARIITFGKAWGYSGAVVLGSTLLKEYLVNFARPFIYSTAPVLSHVLALSSLLKQMPLFDSQRKKLFENIQFFQQNCRSSHWGLSQTAIQTFFVTGNEAVKAKAAQAQKLGFAVKAIVYPTVGKGKERIRITLHASDKKEDMLSLITSLEND